MRPPRATDYVAAAAVLVALAAFALVRVQAVDIPWHLATARLARAIGHFPTRNTFSYTFPDYPLYQQYPVFQTVLYAIYERAGWQGLSVASCVGWAVAFLLFVRWAGPLRAAVPLHLAWMLGLYALQRRMVLRPDLFTMLALGAMLLAQDAYTRGWRWALALVPVIHLLWVNSHQLFPISLTVQALFAGHLVLSRQGWLGVEARATPAPVAVLPALAALAASTALCLATPLGIEIVKVTAHTSDSLFGMRAEVREFSPIWQLPHESALALLTGVPAAWALWCARRRWSPLDTGLWLLSLALMLAAVRGLMFFGIVSIAVLQRTRSRLAAAGQPLLSEVRPRLLRLLERGALVLTLVLGANVVLHRWLRPTMVLGGTQPGLGQSLGGWSDAALAFLARNPPPGRMLNMAWPSGNELIWGLPGQPVFVDPRFESYPHSFLRAAADATRDDRLLAALIEQYHPSWIYAEHFRDAVRARSLTLLHGGWTPVYVDSGHLVLVRDGPDTAAYRAQHAIDLARAEPGDLLSGPPALRAQQRRRFARLMHALGLETRAREQREAARREAGPEGLAVFDEAAS